MDAAAGPSKGTTRKCLICGTNTTSCHLGVDACRACTVFYRRARARKMYACRSNTRRCAIDTEGGMSCKRCRFDRFERILKESGAKEQLDASNSLSEEREPSPVVAHVPSPGMSQASAPSPTLERLLQTSSESSAFSPVSPSVRKDRTLLEKCKLYYKMMSSMRRNCELSSRPNAPHPLQMTEQECPVFPATFSALNAATKIALAGVLEFADYMFPEFAQFSREEKWNLAVSFFYRYQGFDSCYRAHKKFPDDLDKTFGSYTCYFDHVVVESFFDDCPEMKEKQLEEAKKELHSILHRLGRPSRQAITRANPDNDEFHAVLVILFWFTDGSVLRDEIVQIGERYRASVLQELHSYYREELGMSNYATRDIKEIKEHFEMNRLLGVFNDDTFVYQLQKE